MGALLGDAVLQLRKVLCLCKRSEPMLMERPRHVLAFARAVMGLLAHRTKFQVLVAKQRLVAMPTNLDSPPPAISDLSVKIGNLRLQHFAYINERTRILPTEV